MSTAQAPQQPLEELAALREEKSRLRGQMSLLMAEDGIIKAIVESILQHTADGDYESERDNWGAASSHAQEADSLEKILAAHGVEMEEDEDSEEIIHLNRNGKRWRSFHTVEWEWTNEDGKWHWEQDQGDDNPYVPTEWDIDELS